MRRGVLPVLLTCIAFACGDPTYVGSDGVNPFDAGYVPNYGEAGAEAGDAGSSDSGGPVCNPDSGAQPDFTPDKACAADQQCDVLSHEVNCCGSVVIVGITQSKVAAANATESAWHTSLRQSCKACAACDAGPDLAEDGKPGTTVQVHCVGAPSGLCRTTGL